MFSNELHKLLILNIADLDEGVRQFELLQNRIAEKLMCSSRTGRLAKAGAALRIGKIISMLLSRHIIG